MHIHHPPRSTSQTFKKETKDYRPTFNNLIRETMSYTRAATRSSATAKRPVPVRICSYSHTVHRLDCVGHLSIQHGAWYSSVTCYQLQRLLNGEPVTKEQMRVLCDIRNKHYPTKVIKANKEQTAHLLATRQIKRVIDSAIRRDLGGEDDNGSETGDY